MTSRAESTAAAPTPPFPPPPPDPLEAWQDLHPFRETFLRHFTAEGDRDALVHVGRLVFTMAVEYSHYWPETGEEDLVGELRSVAADLRFLHGFLFFMVKESGGSPTADPRREIWLLAKAAEWADQLGEIASEMENALLE
jgi:hypothetical protein